VVDGGIDYVRYRKVDDLIKTEIAKNALVVSAAGIKGE
jgi:hypothetical protein